MGGMKNSKANSIYTQLIFLKKKQKTNIIEAITKYTRGKQFQAEDLDLLIEKIH